MLAKFQPVIDGMMVHICMPFAASANIIEQMTILKIPDNNGNRDPKTDAPFKLMKSRVRTLMPGLPGWLHEKEKPVLEELSGGR